ncbi:MAG: toll/interleukin-1 receptor domain-containing protein, partial [Desulfobacterales bacterium]
MALVDWNEDDWLPLLLTIQQGNCILMLGPDASTEKVDGQSKPCTELLANDLSSKIASEVKAWKIDTNNLAQVSQFYCMKPGRGRTDLLAKVTSFCHSRRHLTSDLHEKLAALPFNLIISTTSDKMLYEAFKKEKKDPIIKSYHFKGTRQEMVPKATTANPLIYHLYGTIDDPSSLVLTENDVLDFIVAVVSKNPPLPDNILSEIRNRNKSFLFLGFGFRNWYLRILLHVLRIGIKESRSFALEQFNHPDIDEFHRTMVFFRESEYKIQICRKELHEFVTELQDRYKKFVGATSAEKSAIENLPPDAPQVFICHASEDKEFASGLYNQLRQEGIRPWLDKENLRGGDQW